MSFEIKLTAGAGTDIQEARNWYENQRSGLGEEFILSVEACLNRIKRNPLHFQQIRDNFRAGIVNRFPFRIIFFLDENSIVVNGVIHMKRNPVIWTKK